MVGSVLMLKSPLGYWVQKAFGYLFAHQQVGGMSAGSGSTAGAGFGETR